MSVYWFTLGAIGGAFVGTTVGVVIMSLLIAAKHGDE